MWFQRFADRLEAEKQAVAALAAEGWVYRAKWHVDEVNGVVTADVDFEAGGQLREAKLVFPFAYPFCPLQVMPRAEGVRWSEHQWPNGELCLELRAENWRDTFDARDMLPKRAAPARHRSGRTTTLALRCRSPRPTGSRKVRS